MVELLVDEQFVLWIETCQHLVFHAEDEFKVLRELFLEPCILFERIHLLNHSVSLLLRLLRYLLWLRLALIALLWLSLIQFLVFKHLIDDMD